MNAEALARLGISETLARSYLAVFNDDAGAAVLRDMALHCGFNAALPAGADLSIHAHHNGLRAAFGRVFEILSLSPGGREQLAALLTPPQPEKENE